jgi:hypothetical protein
MQGPAADQAEHGYATQVEDATARVELDCERGFADFANLDI